MIAIIDCKLGNTGSVLNMLKYLGFKAKVTSDQNEILAANKLILPGVGSFDAGIERIKSLKIDKALKEKVLVEKTPILGICLGMQMLMESSEEGSCQGLCFIPGDVKKISSSYGLKVPHMGWNTVLPKTPCNLTNGVKAGDRFYFVHSYYVETLEPTDTILQTSYGKPFASGVARENIYGVQFHPEKSHKYGKRILENFGNIQ